MNLTRLKKGKEKENLNKTQIHPAQKSK